MWGAGLPAPWTLAGGCSAAGGWTWTDAHGLARSMPCCRLHAASPADRRGVVRGAVDPTTARPRLARKRGKRSSRRATRHEGTHFRL